MSLQDAAFAFAASFLALFPVVNPIGNSFIINSILSALPKEERRGAIKRIIFNCLVIGFGSLALGHFVLLLFGLAIPVIQLGGGFVICKTALDMLNESPSSEADGEGHGVPCGESLKKIKNQLFYPISFPITFGAGTIATIFTLMASASEKGSFGKMLIEYSYIALAIIAILLILYVMLISGHEVLRRLGTSGTLMINKLVAFLTFCIGLQIMLRGIEKIFHITVL